MNRRAARRAQHLLVALALLVVGRGVAQDAVDPRDRVPEAESDARLEAVAAPVELDAEGEARARALSAELRCPVCRSQSIQQSRSFMAEDMKRRVRELVRDGRSDAEIRNYFVDRYGDWILLAPPRRGFQLTAWLLPLVGVAVGGLGIVLAARRWSRRERPEPPPVPAVPSPYQARLDRELERMR